MTSIWVISLHLWWAATLLAPAYYCYFEFGQRRIGVAFVVAWIGGAILIYLFSANYLRDVPVDERQPMVVPGTPASQPY